MRRGKGKKGSKGSKVWAGLCAALPLRWMFVEVGVGGGVGGGGGGVGGGISLLCVCVCVFFIPFSCDLRCLPCCVASADATGNTAV